MLKASFYPVPAPSTHLGLHNVQGLRGVLPPASGLQVAVVVVAGSGDLRRLLVKVDLNHLRGTGRKRGIQKNPWKLREVWLAAVGDIWLVPVCGGQGFWPFALWLSYMFCCAIAESFCGRMPVSPSPH